MGALALLSALAASGGCVGPKAVQYTRMRYNEVYRATNDEQLLMNLVRLRYADSPVFIDLPNITSQFEVSGGGPYASALSGNGSASSNIWFGQIGARDTPTLSYRPREGRDIARGLLTPLSAELFSVVNAGANPEQLLLMTINDINDVPNAPRAATMLPNTPDDNTIFRHGIGLLASLAERDAVELAVGTTEVDEGASDPIPTRLLQGRDLLNAAKDGYVYRAKGDDTMTLHKREKGLVLRVRRAYVNSPEMREFAEVFRLTPGLPKYFIKSEFAEEANAPSRRPLGGDDTIYLNMRSILQIMVFLSKGVCVPEEHVASGVAPSTPGPDGRPYDWTRVTAGRFFVGSQKHRPREAEVAVRYRGYWFSIAPSDVNSRAVLAILEILFSLQEAEGKSVGPLLTLPVSG